MRYDYHNTIEGAKILGREMGLEEGRMVGLAEGEVKGRSEAQAEMAKNLKALGVDIETIAKATGLDAEAVEALTTEQ